MDKLPKLNKNGYPVERFIKITRSLPPAQCELLGELLQEFGKWLVYDSQLKSTYWTRTADIIADKYKDAQTVAVLVQDKGFILEDALKSVYTESTAFASVEDLEQYALIRIKHYSKLANEQRNKDIIKLLLDGATLSSVAEQYGISTSQIHRIHHKWR